MAEFGIDMWFRLAGAVILTSSLPVMIVNPHTPFRYLYLLGLVLLTLEAWVLR